MVRDVGFYSGTFDPVHPGHIAFAKEAMRVCGLSQVIFLPERTPRSKQNVTDLSHRAALLERIINNEPGMSVATLVSEQFTVGKTLPELQRMDGSGDITLLLGSDVICGSLQKWPDLPLLLQNVQLIIGLRGTTTAAQVDKVFADIYDTYGLRARYKTLRAEYAELTSSHIRVTANHGLELNPHITDYLRLHASRK